MSDETTQRPLPAWPRSLPRIGTVGTLFTTACCIGLPAVVSLVTAVGAGFLLTDRYLQPLLMALILVTVAASGLTYSRHRNLAPLIVTVLSGGAIYWFIYRDYRVQVVWVAALALIAAQVWDALACARVRFAPRAASVSRSR
jgi:hypothetical protein